MKGASPGLALALPANIRLGWKGLPAINARDYYKNQLLTAVKSFITLAPAKAPKEKPITSFKLIVNRIER